MVDKHRTDGGKSQATESDSEVIHVLLKLKFVDEDFEVADAVEAHNQIARDHGCCWLGKFGSPFSKKLNDLISSEIEATRRPKLYLYYGPDGDRRYYAAEIKTIGRDITPDTHLYPDYYEKFRRDVLQWFKISELQLVSEVEVSRLVVASNKKPVSEVAPRCMSSHLVVTDLL